MHSISPNFFVQNMQATIDFYRKIGFNVVNQVPEQGELIWVMMTSGEVSLMFQSFESLGDELPAIHRNNGGSLLLYIQMKGLRELYERIKNEVTIVQDLHKTFYGATEFAMVDLNGFVITFAENE